MNASLILSILFAILPTFPLAHGSELSTAKRELGQDNFVQLDVQAGVFSGLRLKGLIYSADTYNLAVEGLYGGSLFAENAFFPPTYGAGFRTELYLFSATNHAWIVSPGLNAYWVPRWQEAGSLFGSVTQTMISLAPTIELNWLYQFAPHFGVVIGGKLGAAFMLSGLSRMGGIWHPDGGLYLGFRI